MANPALVGSGLNELRESLKNINKGGAVGWGAQAGLMELVMGGSKLKAVIESIKWAAFARAGVAGFAAIVPMVYALTTGIRKAVTESGILQAAMQRIGETKMLTTQFTQFLGSVQLARQRVGELYAFVANSKFDMSEVANASKVLSILTNGVEGGINTLQTLGKVSTVTGNSLQELALYYGKFSEQVRKGEDISGTVQQLKDMGVVNESTANSFLRLQATGASATTMMNAFHNSIAAVAAVGGTAGESMEELQNKVAKLQATAAEGFGKAWMEQENQDLKNQVMLWTAVSEASERFGTNLEMISGSTTKLKNVMYAATGTDFFKSSLKTLSDMVVTLPIAIASYIALRSIMAGKIPGADTVRGLINAGRTVMGFNPAALASRGAVAVRSVGSATETGAAIRRTTATGLEGLSAGLTRVWAGFTRLMGILSRAAPAIAIVSTAAIVASKLWDDYRESQDRAANATKNFNAATAVRAGMAKEIAGIKTMDDKTKALAVAHERLNNALKEQARIREDLKSTDEEKAGAVLLVKANRQALTTVQGVKATGLDTTQKEFEYRMRQIGVELQIKDIQYQAAMGRSNAVNREILANKRLADLKKDMAERETIRKMEPDLKVAQDQIDAFKKERATELAGYQAKEIALQNRVIPRREGETEEDYGPKLAKQTAEELADVRKNITRLKTEPSAGEAESIALRKRLIERGNSEYRLLMLKADEEKDAKKAGELRLEAARLMARKNDEVQLEIDQLEDTRAERRIAAAREVADYQTSMQVRRLMNQSMIQVANGQFALASATQKAAQDIQDRNDDNNRLNELLLQGGYFSAKAIADKANEDKKITSANRKEKDEELARRSAFQPENVLSGMSPTLQGLLSGTQLKTTLAGQQWTGSTPEEKERARAAGEAARIKSEADKRLEEETKQRDQDRAAAKEARTASVTRGIEDLELGQIVRGQRPGDAAAAREKLTGRKDQEAFMRNYEEMTQGLVGMTDTDIAGFTDLAKRKTMAEMTPGSQQGAGSMGDSLTRVGGGGGFYAGAAGTDPMLAMAKRQNELQNLTLDQLKEMNTKGIMLKGGIK